MFPNNTISSGNTFRWKETKKNTKFQIWNKNNYKSKSSIPNLGTKCIESFM